ncbi:MAG: hypothetical protein HQK98_10640 [Nitrospirae bacterium]|nr:hypothetical protein [Nitrospirota bacterium]
MKSRKFLVATCLIAGLFAAVIAGNAGNVSAFDIKGINPADALKPQGTEAAKPNDTKPDASSPKTSKEEKSYTNNTRKFTFTIPAGWEISSGTPDSDNMVFRKTGTTQHFAFQYTQLASDFPAEASVKASLKTAMEDIKHGKNIAAKRRDDVKKVNGKNVLYARGWELIDAGKNGPQRIIWQCYDRENFYFNFMASAQSNEFDEAKPTLQKIIDSIKFLE